MTSAGSAGHDAARPLFPRVAVVGLGLIGGSLALAARARGLFGHVTGVGRNRANLEVGLARGAIDHATADLAEAVRGADLVVLAVPVGSMAEAARVAAASLSEPAIVTDVGSVKARLVEDVERALGGRGRFVGGHPIAGTERSGMAAAITELFDGRCCVLTPNAATDPDALARVRALWEGLGMRVVDLDAARHDRILAMVSHLPHLVAYALAGEVEAREAGGEDLVSFSAGGLKDFTRVAASDPTLWTEICLMNRDEIGRSIASYRARLAHLEALIADGNAAELATELARAGALRARLV